MVFKQNIYNILQKLKLHEPRLLREIERLVMVKGLSGTQFGQ